MENPNQPIENKSNSQISVTSVLIIEDETKYPILLRYSTSKNLFLTKVSFYFMIYMVCLSLVCFVIVENPRLAKYYYRLFYLNYIDIFVFILWIFFKAVFCLFGKFIRKMAFVFFVFDLVVSVLATLALYFRLENYVELQYIYNGHYLIIYVTTIGSSCIAFFVTTIYRAGPQIYSVFKGVTFMSLCNLLPILMFRNRWEEILLKNSRYFLVWLSLVVFNYYVAKNSWILVNCRGHKFYDHEHIYAFECYFSDFIWNFWVDSRDKTVRKEENETDSESATPNSADQESDVQAPEVSDPSIHTTEPQKEAGEVAEA